MVGRRRAWIMLAAASVGAWIAWDLLGGQSVGSHRTLSPTRTTESSIEISEPTAGTKSSVDQPRSTLKLIRSEIRIIDAVTEQPVQGAIVQLMTGRLVAQDPLVFAEVRTLQEASADAEGSVQLQTSPGTSSEFLVVEARSYLRRIVRIGHEHGASRTVRLERGVELTGTLGDLDGKPLRGVRIHVSAVDAPRAGSKQGIVAGASYGTATTNESGEFAVSGLSPGEYCVSLLDDGWAAYRIEGGTPIPGAEGVSIPARLSNVYAGTGTHSQITAYPIRAYQFQLVDAASGAPLRWRVQAAVLDPRHQFVPIFSGSPQSSSGRYAGTLVVRALESQVPDTARMILSVSAGALSCRNPRPLIEVRLRAPADAARSVQNVPIEVPEYASGSIQFRIRGLDEQRASKPLWIWLRPLGESRPIAVMALRKGPDLWETSAVPAGACEYRVQDPFATEWAEIQVPAGSEQVIELEAPRRTGIRLRMRTEGGRALFDAQRIDIIPEPEAMGASGKVWLPRDPQKTSVVAADPSLALGADYDVLHPGRYRVAIQKRGFSPWNGWVDIPADSMLDLVATLVPNRASGADDR